MAGSRSTCAVAAATDAVIDEDRDPVRWRYQPVEHRSRPLDELFHVWHVTWLRSSAIDHGGRHASSAINRAVRSSIWAKHVDQLAGELPVGSRISPTQVSRYSFGSGRWACSAANHSLHVRRPRLPTHSPNSTTSGSVKVWSYASGHRPAISTTC